METVVLVVLLLIALALIAVVLLQRSEGGGLGMGAGGLMTGRAQATALGRMTWWLGGAFMAASLALTVIAARNGAGSSVVDQIGADVEEGAGAGALGDDSSLLPPPAADAPLVPLDDLGGATEAPAETPSDAPAEAPAEAPLPDPGPATGE